MAEMTIQLRVDPDSGKKDIVIRLKSDDDSLPHEHEQQHRALVDQLLEGGMVKADELGRVVIEREEEGEVSAPTPQAAAEDQGTSASEGA